MLQQLKTFLDKHQIKYVVISHSPAFTAQEIAESAHIPGHLLAKTVILRADGKLVMFVEAAPQKANLSKLNTLIGPHKVQLADETEFMSEFPGCQTGAMPPLGNLFDMDVYVDDELAKNKDIYFNAGNHHELIKISFDDFVKLVKPKLV